MNSLAAIWPTSIQDVKREPVPSDTSALHNLYFLSANHVWLGQMVVSQRAGRGCLPYALGLSDTAFTDWVNENLQFDEALQILATAPIGGVLAERSQLRKDLLQLRQEEFLAIKSLLEHAYSNEQAEKMALADILAAACLGGDHLWRDLGLVTRRDLSDLMYINFQSLALANTKDMKWKKFFYKALCDQEGGYVCRSPSCESCSSYDDCFGDENG